MDYQKLKLEISSSDYTGLSDEQVCEKLNAKTVNVPQNIAVADIKAYLTLTGKRLAIEEATDDAAKSTRLAFGDFQTFVMSNPANVAALTGQLDALIAAGHLTLDDKNGILGLGETMVSPATQLGLGVVRQCDVDFARTL